MKPNLSDYPENGSHGLKNQWKIDFEKALLDHCLITRSGHVLYTTITIKELLGK